MMEIHESGWRADVERVSMFCWFWKFTKGKDNHIGMAWTKRGAMHAWMKAALSED